MIYLAIDPGKVCGVAWRVNDGEMLSTVVKIHELVRFLGISKMAWSLIDSSKTLVAIEKMSGRWGRSREHKAQANQVYDIIKSIWPRRKSRVRFVDPRVWQRAVTLNAPGKTPKERSLFAASNITGRIIADHNEADAVCLLHWLIVTTQLERGFAG